jgi:hypothetical protein
MEKVKKVEVPIPEGFKAEAKFANGVMTIEIEKIETETKKKEWHLEVNKKYYYIESMSEIDDFKTNEKNSTTERNSFRHESDAKAMLAYIQLLEMYYQEIGDYVPNWVEIQEAKFVIRQLQNNFTVDAMQTYHFVFAFPTREQAEKFLFEYSDLIEQAKRFI